MRTNDLTRSVRPDVRPTHIHAATNQQADILKLLRTLVEPCEGADDHAWRKCRRCAAIHGVEMRFPLSMRLLQAAIEGLEGKS